jgi:hypothetical protein
MTRKFLDLKPDFIARDLEQLAESLYICCLDSGCGGECENRVLDGLEVAYRKGQESASTLPIDVILFCPKCLELHIDKAKPDVCETCGRLEIEHSSRFRVEQACLTFKAWLNPPHKSHRCGNCNFVWRPADVPTNGVAHAKTKGENDTMKRVGDIRRAARGVL